MKKWTILFFSAALVGCAAVPLAPPTQPIFNDDLFVAPSQQIDAAQIFNVSPEMKRFLHTEITSQVTTKGLQQALYDALYAEGQLMLDYDSAITRTASQAFDAKSGNCLSMAVMTAAMAKEIGLRVQYRNIEVNESWSRVGQTYFLSGHVNVTLSEKRSPVRADIRGLMTIDFVPATDFQHRRADIIEEETIIAMYMNNRAAESLAAGQLDNAYWFAREAIKQDPHFPSAYNTLGVIYKKHGNLIEAERVFSYILSRQPQDAVVMSNLIPTLHSLNRGEEAKVLAQKLTQLRPYPPFHFFNQGVVAMKNGDYRLAKSLFQKEVDRAPDYHEFQYWLALAHLRLGEIKKADKYINLAMENSTTRKDHEVYAAKRDQLRGIGSTH